MSGFDQFWALYPRRVAKKDALKAWLKLDAEQQQKAIEAAGKWQRVWAGMELQFIPHPATWLNGWRFEDELPQENRIGAAAHLPAKMPDVPREAVPAEKLAFLKAFKR